MTPPFRRVRGLPLLTSLALAATGSSGVVQALTLGDVQALTGLGLPLRLDVPLTLAPGESAEGLQVSVRARPLLGSDAGWLAAPFRVVLNENGGSTTLRLCNEAPGDEPALELHLAVRLADGSVTRRQYDLLLDPARPGQAFIACTGTPAVPARAAVPAAPSRAVAPRQRAAASASPLAAPTAISGTYGPVVEGETLGSIAQQVRGALPLRLPVVMDALHQANPAAFFDGPDGLRAGSVLLVPDLAALMSPSAIRPETRMAGLDVELSAPAPVAPQPQVPPAEPERVGMLSLRLSDRLAQPPSAAQAMQVAEHYRLEVAAPAAVLPPVLPVVEAAPEASPLQAPAVVAAAATSDLEFLSDLVQRPWVSLLLGMALAYATVALARTRRRPAPPAARGAAAPAAAPQPKPEPMPLALPVAAAAPKPAASSAPVRTVLPAFRNPEPEPDADVVGHAFYDEIETLLTQELLKNPGRRDLRYRLLDLCFNAGKADAFVEQTKAYLGLLRGTADENWPRIVRMGRQLVPDSTLYTDVPGSGARSAAAVIPLRSARNAVRRFYEYLDSTALDGLRRQLGADYSGVRADAGFWKELTVLADGWTTINVPLVSAERLTQHQGGARVYFCDERLRARDDGAVLVALGQVLLASRLGYRRVVAGGLRHQHGLTVARAALQLGLDCTLHLSREEQVEYRDRLEALDGKRVLVETVADSARGLEANIQIQALREALEDPRLMYVSPMAAGPQPYPTIVLDLISLVGRNLRTQMVDVLGRVADVLITHRADSLHALGLLHPFLERSDTRLVCVEPTAHRNEAALFPREHQLLRTSGRVEYPQVHEEAARFAAQFVSEQQYSGMGLAASEVFATAMRLAREIGPGGAVVAVLPSEQGAGSLPVTPMDAGIEARRST